MRLLAEHIGRTPRMCTVQVILEALEGQSLGEHLSRRLVRRCPTGQRAELVHGIPLLFFTVVVPSGCLGRVISASDAIF